MRAVAPPNHSPRRPFSLASPRLAQFDPAWLQFLACPLTKTPLEYDEARQELVSRHIGVAFPIVRGIPRLVPTEGRLLDPAAGVTVPSPKENGGQ